MAVEILESSMVAPAEATPSHGLWLSNIDHLASRGHTPMVFFYRPGSVPTFFSPGVLKAALSKALVPFYPLAGRLAPAGTDRWEIRCTGEGALFVTARTDAALSDMGEFAPSDELRRMLVPSAEGPDRAGVLFMSQLTLFKCGAVCLGTAIHNKAADGRAFGNLINTWAAIARGVGDDAAVPLLRPCLDRTPLRARSPPAVRFDHALYSWRGGGPPKAPLDVAVLPVSRTQVDALKGTHHGSKQPPVTTFNAVAAHVWRCACRARGLAGSTDTRLYITADARSRVRPPLPAGYLGNAVVRALAVAKVDDVVAGPLAAAAARVSDAVAGLSDEYIRSLVDYVEQAPSNAAGLRIAGWPGMPETDVWVTSWLGLRFSGVDFGWGRPVCVGRATLMFSGQVYVLPSPDDDGGLQVGVAMEPERLARFKELFYESLKVSDMHQVKRSNL